MASLLSRLNPKNKAKGPPRHLREQFMTHASIDAKIHATFLAVGMLDALGNPLQNQPRVPNRVIDEMLPTADRPAGVWTDDTAMMLCISSAIASTVDPEENRVEQILALREWKDHGVNSSTNVCFDLKPQVKEAIETFTQHDRPDHALHIIRSNFCGDNDFNNTSGSLSRVLPLGISFWREPDQARIYGKLSSEITHPSLLCKESSSLIAFLIALILQQVVDAPWKSRDEDDKKLSKLTLIHQIARFPFENNDLHKYLTVPFGTGERPTAEDELESWYFRHLPLLRSIVRHQFTDPNPYPSLPFILPPVDQLQTRDHALDVTLAALYCFFATRNFEEGALMAVNLCGESSTVGAVYASLAAPFYVGDEEKDKLFWTKKVREWRKALQRQDLLEVEARKMIALAYQRLEEERQS